MRRTRISRSTLSIAVLSLLLIGSIALTATGSWFTSQNAAESAGSETFGIVSINEVGTYATVSQTPLVNLDTELMPGDSMTIDLTVQNDSNVEAFIRIRLDMATDGDPVMDLNTETAFRTALASGLVGWTLSEGWYYKDVALAEDEDVTIAPTFTIPTSVGDTFQNETVSFQFEVQAVQAANNGTDPLLANGWV